MKKTITKYSATTEEVELIEGMCFKGDKSFTKVLPDNMYLNISTIEVAKEYSIVLDYELAEQISQREFYEACLTAIQKLQSQIELIQQHL